MSLHDRPADDIAEHFRMAMRSFATSVTIVTTEASGARYGITATSVTALSMQPPSVLFCIHSGSSMRSRLLDTGRACVNVLAREHAGLCAQFSRGPNGEARFAAGRWVRGHGGLPCLLDAQACIHVRIQRTIPYASHEIFIGDVEHVERRDDIAPLVYVDGHTTELDSADRAA